MRASAHHLTRLGVAVAVTTAVMCADPDAALDPDAAQGDISDATPVGVRYHLAWAWGDAEPTEDGWTVVNDRGYEVRVTDGYLVTYSVQLAPCTEGDLDTGLGRLFGIGRAHAGHGGEEDPSAWITGLAEPLASPEVRSLEPVIVDSGTYCRVHYLVARAETGTLDLPEEMDLMGTSLYIEGTVASAGDEPEPFTIWSTLPTGQLMTWSDPVTPIDLDADGLDVTITRDLGHLFDGVEFATMSAESVEKTILLGLAERVSVRVE
jgi:hypothetical protein